jgi:hypothetical protein
LYCVCLGPIFPKKFQKNSRKKWENQFGVIDNIKNKTFCFIYQKIYSSLKVVCVLSGVELVFWNGRRASTNYKCYCLHEKVKLVATYNNEKWILEFHKKKTFKRSVISSSKIRRPKTVEVSLNKLPCFFVIPNKVIYKMVVYNQVLYKKYFLLET